VQLAENSRRPRKLHLPLFSREFTADQRERRRLLLRTFGNGIKEPSDGKGYTRDAKWTVRRRAEEN